MPDVNPGDWLTADLHAESTAEPLSNLVLQAGILQLAHQHCVLKPVSNTSVPCMMPVMSAIQCSAHVPAEFTAEPLSNLILQATKSSKTRAEQLCHGPAAAALASLLWYVRVAEQSSSMASTLGLIVHHVIWQWVLLGPAMVSLTVLHSQGLGACSGGKVDLAVCKEHVTMLQLLADELEQPTANR